MPLGDFFCLGHGMVNSFQSALFSASTHFAYMFNKPCALNSYVPMPFARSARVELVNESDQPHYQYFYVDYESLEEFPPDLGYFHAEFRRANPFQGWGPQVGVNTPEADLPNLERQAWDSNYVILETRGRGHYIGCNLSVTNFTRNWWGEGDDMIWVDGYHWPPDLHGTGSEDYFNQAFGMQPNAFLRNGSSVYEGGTVPCAGDRAVPRRQRLPDQLRLPPGEPGAFHERDQSHHRDRARQPSWQRNQQRGLLVCREACAGHRRTARAAAPARAPRQRRELAGRIPSASALASRSSSRQPDEPRGITTPARPENRALFLVGHHRTKQRLVDDPSRRLCRPGGYPRPGADHAHLDDADRPIPASAC